MKKLSLLTIVLIVISSMGMAQKKDASSYMKGDIFLEDGSTINAYIYYTNWHAEDFQNSVTYLTSDQYEKLKSGEKLKSKEFTELKTKEVKYYKLEDGTKMNKVKYADLTAASAASFPKYYFFEQIAEGKINMYKKHYVRPTVVSGEEAVLEGQELLDYINSKFTCLIQKGDENTKDLVNVKIQEYVEDNPDVLAKLEAGEYGSINTVFGSKLGSDDVNYTKYIEGLTNMANDYNN